MWSPALAEACARHPDLAAVHESPTGTLALVLRHTIVPLPEERGTWLSETRAAAQGVVDDLRRAGFAGRTVVAQWLSVPRLDYVFDTWPSRWEGDAERAAQLRDLAGRLLADRRFLAYRRAVAARRARIPREPQGIRRWYCTMAPTWLGIQPEVRRKLVLQTHVWIVERVLEGETWPGAAEDLEEDGVLVHRLERLIRPADRPHWQPWIAAVLAGLARELARRGDGHGHRWIRRLFLVAWRVPPPAVARGVSLRAL
jgi:hypothetical protein